MDETLAIIGQGLAGSCLAWHLHWRGRRFTLHDDRREGAASRVAAGMINPVTGKNYSAGWRHAEFLAEAEDFYAKVAQATGRAVWFPQPVIRLVTAAEWPKVQAKRAAAELAPWIERVEEAAGGDWSAAVVLRGGGRVAVREFCEATAEYFGVSERAPEAGVGVRRVFCEGAAGLIAGRLGRHRCAKGEILTLRSPATGRGIRIGGGGWLVPLGEGIFKCGATYTWDVLDGRPTEEGRRAVERIAARLLDAPFEVTGHEAGVRPIVRRSQPVIGPLADEGGAAAVFNGLGSKGSLYAPGVAARLASWLADGGEIDAELDVRKLT